MRLKTFLLAALLLFDFCASNAQSNQKNLKSATQGVSQSPSAFFNGAWRNTDDKGFAVMHDGYFNSVGPDSTGKWSDVHAGTYVVNGDNTITFTVLYSSWPDHVGSKNTADYTISGETVKMHHFKKLIDAQGKDMTDTMPKDAWETIERMK